MLKFLVASVALVVFTTGNVRGEASPLSPKCEGCSSWISEVGFVFPTRPVVFRDFYAANNVNPVPLTSGLGYGAQFGRHLLIGNSSTIGVVTNANAFYSSLGNTTQIYQVAAYFLARAYMNESWRSGIFAELGAGPEVSATSFNGSTFAYQGNISTRIGVGYNHKFNEQFSVGATFVVVPSVTSNNVLDGSRVVVNMLW